MPEREAQTYATHVQRIPRLFLAGCAAVAIYLLWSLVDLVRHPGVDRALATLAWAGAGVLAFYTRRNAQIVQDRLIRLEERLRLERLLPEDLRARIPEFSMGQLIALRFASDEELPALARAVLEERLRSRDEIKRRIRSWRPDRLRV